MPRPRSDGSGSPAFVGVYLAVVFLRTNAEHQPRWVHAQLLVLGALGLLMTFTLGEAFLVLFVYLAVGCGAVLPSRRASWALPLVAAVLAAVAGIIGASEGLVVSLLVPCLLGGFSMTGVSRLVRTTRELREARAAIAQLAANEERLRLARDLHDLLGHSLSLITLKSELAGRMLPDRPEDAAAAGRRHRAGQPAGAGRRPRSRQRLPQAHASPPRLAGARVVAARPPGVRAVLPVEPSTAPLTPEAEARWPGRCARPSPMWCGTAAPARCAVEPSPRTDGTVPRPSPIEDAARTLGGTAPRQRPDGPGGAAAATPAAAWRRSRPGAASRPSRGVPAPTRRTSDRP